MSKKKLSVKPSNQTADEQVTGLVKLMRFMAWKNLTKGGLDSPPHEQVEDIIQDALVEFLLRVRSGKVRNPKGYLYYFIRGFCADALGEFVKERRRFGASLSFEFGGGDDNDGRGQTILDWVYVPWDDPAFLLEYGDYETFSKHQEQREKEERSALKKVLDEVLADEPSASLWRRKAEWPGCSYAGIARDVGLTPGQVRGRMTRSAPRLRRRLRKLGYTGRGKINRAG